MADANDFIRIVKQAAKEAVAASAPSDVMTGTVTSVKPVMVKVEQRFEIGPGQLVIPEYLTDHVIPVTVSTSTDKAGEPEHVHPVRGNKTVTVHNSLEVGDQVILIRQSGGQKFIIIDRVVT